MKAVILLSGGLDSATALAMAKDQGYECYALSYNYGQRHAAELDAAAKVASAFNVVEHKTIELDLTQIGGSALTDNNIDIPESPDRWHTCDLCPGKKYHLSFLCPGLGRSAGHQ